MMLLNLVTIHEYSKCILFVTEHLNVDRLCLIQEIVNTDVFCVHLTDGEQQDLLKYLPDIDISGVSDRLVPPILIYVPFRDILIYNMTSRLLCVGGFTVNVHTHFSFFLLSQSWKHIYKQAFQGEHIFLPASACRWSV